MNFDNKTKAKTEPTADMRAMARTAWQMHVAFMDEGFTESQALVLVNNILVTGVQTPPE